MICLDRNHPVATDQFHMDKQCHEFLCTKVTMPYVNQTAVDQHMRAQPAPVPPRMSLSPMNGQSPKHVQSPQLPDSVQPQRLPFVDAPPAPAKNYHADNTSSPSTHETTSKSLNRRGVKQSSSESSLASTSTGKSGPICWNCREVGHRRHNCKNLSYCPKCKQSGHLPMKCPLPHALQRHILKSLRILQVIKRMIKVPLQVMLTLMIFLLLAPRTANQLLQT